MVKFCEAIAKKGAQNSKQPTSEIVKWSALNPATFSRILFAIQTDLIRSKIDPSKEAASFGAIDSVLLPLSGILAVHRVPPFDDLSPLELPT